MEGAGWQADLKPPAAPPWHATPETPIMPYIPTLPGVDAGAVTVYRGLSQFSRHEGCCSGKTLNCRENGTVPLGRPIPLSIMPKRSAHQDRIIRNYYQNRDEIMLQRLGELVTDLFLAEGGARTRIWRRVADTMEKLKVPKGRIQHLVNSDNPALVANELKKLLEKLK